MQQQSLSQQQAQQIVANAWRSSQGYQTGDDASRQAEAGQSGGSNQQAIRFAQELVGGFQQAGCTELAQISSLIQQANLSAQG